MSYRNSKDPQKLDSYRQIYLTSTFGKVMERLVTNRLRYETETRHLLSEKQAGFWSGCGTENQLFQLSQSISNDFQCSTIKTTVLILIDYSRAYEHVWRDTLLLKMLRKGVSPHGIGWIQVWLANRQNRETFEVVKCKKTIQKQGVPQGSVVSPLQLNVFIHDQQWGSGDQYISPIADDEAILAQDSKLNMVEA